MTLKPDSKRISVSKEAGSGCVSRSAKVHIVCNGLQVASKDQGDQDDNYKSCHSNNLEPTSLSVLALAKNFSQFKRVEMFSMSERANIHPIMLPTEFYLAIADVMSKLRIGKSAAILLMLAEGLRKSGYLDEEIFGLYKARYSKPLLQIVRGNREEMAEAGREKIRCSWAAGSSEKCRRIATVMLKLGNKVIPSCPEHIQEFQEHGYEVLKET